MAKKVKQCDTCEHWKGTDKDKNLCSEIVTGVDVFIGGGYLKTASHFGCNKFKEKEVQNDSISDTNVTDSLND